MAPIDTTKTAGAFPVSTNNPAALAAESGRPMELPTRLLTGFLFFVLGILILVLLLLITVATAITKSNWWIRRRRSCQRRIEHLGMGKSLPIEDRVFYYTNIVMEALALHWDEDEDTVGSSKPLAKPKICERVNAEGTQIPLRFQPEKLYGATSTVHRDNLRKRSCSFLSLQPTPDGHRRASMIESLSFLSPSSCQKETKSSSDQPPRLVDYKLAYPQYEGTQASKWNATALPQIDVTCDQDASLTGDETDIIDGSRSDREVEDASVISIAIPARRASARDVQINVPVLNRRASFVDTFTTPTLPTINIPTEDGGEEKLVTDDKIDTNTLRPIQPLIVKRNSLVEGLTSFRTISLTDDEPRKQTDSEGTATNADYEENEGRRISLTVAESPVKIPHPPALNRVTESPAGQLALSLTSVEDKTAASEKLVVSFLMAKLLKSPRPWQKSNFSLKCTYHSLNNVQHATIICKDGEFGRLRFPHGAQVTFDLYNRQPKQHVTTMNQLKISIFEGGSKWSTDKEFYHGTVNIQMPGIHVLSGKPEWHSISAAYPVIRIKADLLVSLCQRPWEGFVSVGVHEIRNIELQKKGPYSIGDLDQLTNIEQSGFEIHACLTFDGRLIKSKKSVFLQQPRQSLHKESQQPTAEKRLSIGGTKHRMSFSRTVSGEHYLQFSLPSAKKNTGKLLLSNYGIVLFVSHKLTLTDQLPADYVNQLKLLGAPELKTLQAVGECFIADESTQSEYWSTVSFNAKCDAQCATLWNEAASHGCSRVYQWLTTV